MTTLATYTKLRDGSWGVRVSSATIKAGASVAVRKASGETKTEKVTRVVWHDASTSICAIERSATPPRSDGGTSNVRETYRRRYGWDGVVGSSSYYASGLYDEES